MGLSSIIGRDERRLIDPDAWREDALCKGLNVGGWIGLPKALCFECPVRKECLWDAIFYDDHQISHDYFLGGNHRITKFGYQPCLVRGGIMAPERKRIYILCKQDPYKTYETSIDLHLS